MKSAASGPVTLEILNSQNQLVRRFASTDKPEPVNEKELDIPTYWIRPTPILPANAGSHRFVWDLHYRSPPGQRGDYPISAIYRDTPREPRGPWVLPGEYTVRLTVDGQAYTQPFTVRMDPRVTTPPHGLAQQFDLSMQVYKALAKVHNARQQLRTLRNRLAELKKKTADASMPQELQALENKLAALEGPSGRFRFFARPGGDQPLSLGKVQGELLRLLVVLQEADTAPTPQATIACAATSKSIEEVLKRWTDLQQTELKAFNQQLREHGLETVKTQGDN